MKFIAFLTILGIVSCQKLKNSQEGNRFNKYELTEINGFPPEIDGCSCYYSKTIEALQKNKFIYLNDMGDIEIISLNEKMKIIDLADEKKLFKVEILIQETEQLSYEFSYQSGLIKIYESDNLIAESQLVGHCGC